jgi:hypothetical protein
MFGILVEVLVTALVAPCGSQGLPSGGPVAGAAETLRIDEALQGQDRMSEGLLPILTDAAGDPAQHEGGQIGIGLGLDKGC